MNPSRRGSEGQARPGTRGNRGRNRAGYSGAGRAGRDEAARSRGTNGVGRARQWWSQNDGDDDGFPTRSGGNYGSLGQRESSSITREEQARPAGSVDHEPKPEPGGPEVSKITEKFAKLSTDQQRPHPPKDPYQKVVDGPNIPLAIRPDFGAKGQKVDLRCNHFAVSVPRDLKIYCYDVEVHELHNKDSFIKLPKVANNKSEQENIKLRRYKAFRGMVAANQEKFPHTHYLYYNRSKMLYSPKILPCLREMDEYRIVHSLPEHPQIQYEFRISFTNRDPVDMNNLLPVIERDDQCSPDMDAAERRRHRDREVMTIYELMFNQSLYDLENRLNLIPAGRAFYGIECAELLNGGKVALGLGRTLAQGLFKAHAVHMRAGRANPSDPTDVQLNVNVDVANTAYYVKQSVIEFMQECIGFGREKRLPDVIEQKHCILLRHHLTGVVVECIYEAVRGRPRMVQRFEVGGVTLEPAYMLTFKRATEHGTETVTVKEYLERTYAIKLRYPDFPCIVKRNVTTSQTPPDQKKNPPCYFPVEFCHIVEKQRVAPFQMKDAELTSKMIKATAVPPQERFQRLQRIIEEAGLKDDPYIRLIGMKRLFEYMKIVGRVIDAPRMQLLQPNMRKAILVDVVKGVFRMDQNKYFNPGHCEKYMVVSLDNDGLMRSGSDYVSFAKNFVQAADKKGISFGQQEPVKLASGQMFVDFRGWMGPEVVMSPDSIRDFLDDLMKHLAKKNVELSIMIVFLPAKDDRAVKPHVKSVAAKHGIITQCLNAQNARKIAVGDRCDALLENVMHKVNSRLGGKNWQLFDHTKVLTKFLGEGNATMFVGVDVAHPPPKPSKDAEDTLPSVVAVCASSDTNHWCYNPIARLQYATRQEFIDCMDEVMEEQLRNYMQQVGRLPDRIVIYRDGVGESMIQGVLDRELVGVKKACRKVYGPPSPLPKITFCLTLKRHHTRFFKSKFDSRAKDSANNVDPGTVVDTGPVHPTDFEFYLCSHLGIKGTSRPAKYHVLFDENDFKSDDFQSLCYFMCHMFHRCTRSISMPAPVAMAHHFADHIAQLIKAHYEMVEIEIKKKSFWTPFCETKLETMTKEYADAYKNRQFFL